MKTKKMFPLYVDLSEKHILVAGGGTIGERRVKSLLSFAGKITVVSPELTEELKSLAEEGRITWICRNYEKDDLDSADIVLGATDHEEVNYRIYSDCREKQITVNISNDKSKCDFYFPGIIQHDDIVIGFNGGGTNHRKTREVREQVQKFLEEEK